MINHELLLININLLIMTFFILQTNVLLNCFALPLEEFPDYFPSGQYKFNIILYYKHVNLFILDIDLTFY